MKEIESSVMKEIKTKDGNLIVTFKSGKIYSYIGAANEYEKIINADSAGFYFNNYIKKYYDSIFLS